jgi:hypothetical protein
VSMLKRCSFYFFFMLMLYTAAKAQSVRTIKQEMDVISTYNTGHTPEKIFIHTDKQNYSKEDTLWFKAYVFDAASLGAATKSGIMYIEIADANNRVINRNLVSLTAGLGWGNIPLVDHRFPEGTYTLRAYTSWMRNFDEHYIFSRQFTIEGPLDEDWMINSRFELSEMEGISNVKTDLSFITNEGHRMFAEELKAKITAGRRTLYRTTLTTGADGTLAFDFNLPDKTGTQQLNIALTKKRTKQSGEVTFNVPVIINRDEKTDLQFMPEGGSLINGMLNKVAFKAINEEGKGVDVQGGVYNSVNQKVADLRSVHLGMGTFELKPEANQIYTAKINYKDKQLSFPLPQAKSSGLLLNVGNTASADSIIIVVSSTLDIQNTGQLYYLIGQANNTVCYGAMINTARGTKRLSVHRNAFPTGVARFTLLSQAGIPVAERIIFIDHHDEVKLSIVPSKALYGSRDSVKLDVFATNKQGAPLQGSFSLAVTDDTQVKLDRDVLGLPAKVLLADDLKGSVENPQWYFSKGDSLAKVAALDALMLTQGWVNYNWKGVFSEKQKEQAYKAEPEFAVKGRVVNAFSKPLDKSNVVLLSRNPTFVTDTLTNSAGEFVFTNLYPSDTVVYNLQAKNKRGRMFNVGIEVDEFVPPIFSTPQQRLIPPYVNIDTARLKALRAKQLYKEEEAKITGTQLNEVQIKAKKAVKDSKSLVGPGEADFTLNEEELKEVGKSTLLNVIEKNVKGFNSLGKKGASIYNINRLFTVFIIDGVNTMYFNQGGSYYQYMKSILEYILAEDVKGVEVMTSGHNQLEYTSEYISPRNPLARFYDFTFIEITTYSGNGLFAKKTPGNYLYRPPVFASVKEFYAPKYAVKKPVVIPDTRATLFWAPNIITDNNGRASVSFYTADKAGTYSVNMQGADMEGLVGAAQSKIAVKKSP